MSSGKTKIYDFNNHLTIIIKANQNIVRFDISVSNSLRMEVIDSLQSSIEDGFQDFFIENEPIVTKELLKGNGSIDVLED